MFNQSNCNQVIQGVFKNDFSTFLGLSDQSVNELMPERKDARGKASTFSAKALLCGMCYSTLHGIGKLSSNLKRATGKVMSDSGIFQHRQKVPVELLQKVSDHCLQVVSQSGVDSESYYKGRLLVAIDGTTFNLRNSADITKRFPKGKTRKSKTAPLRDVAFARMHTSCLVEVGMHNPLALEVGNNQEAELELSLRLLPKLPPNFMLLCDRLYSFARFLEQVEQQCERLNGAFLIRASEITKKMTLKQTLSDGSRIIEIPVLSKTKRNKYVGTVVVREIRAIIPTREGEHVEVKFWTNLLDPLVYPALELVELYARCGEHELYYGELKTELMDGDLLRSKTLHCAVQEIDIAVWSTAMIARVRASINSELEDAGLVISFQKVTDKLDTIWSFVSLVGIEIDQRIIDAAITGAIDELKAEQNPKRYNRSCPRTIRQNVIHWPKTREYKSFYGEFEYQIIDQATLT